MEEIARIINGEWRPGIPVHVSEYSIDTRSVLHPAATLFFALRGEHRDGHDFIERLYADGGRAFVISQWRPAFDTLTEANFITVPDVLAALQALAAHHRRQLNANVVAITGSNGKTIVKEWLHHLLAPTRSVYRSPRSYNSQVGVPLSLLGIPPTADIALIEAGISRPGEMERLQRLIRPDLGIFTHFGEAHGENFSTPDQKWQEKWQLFPGSRAVAGPAPLLAAGRETLLARPDHAPSIPSLAGWGTGTGSVVELQHLVAGPASREAIVRIRGHLHRWHIPFADKASFENAMTAATAALMLGVDPGDIATRLRQLTPVAMRLEIREGINQCLLVNDYYNSDPDSFRIALNILAMQDNTRPKTVILSDFIDRGSAGDNLYAHVADCLRQAGVRHFIGIGPRLTANRHLFPPDARFHPSTDDFLHHAHRDDFQHQAILIKGARDFHLEYIAAFLQRQSHTTCLEVDLDAIIHNLNYFRSLTTARLAVMVKASSYGSGAREIANLLQYQGVDYLMVAFADEGVDLRAAGITLPIAVMNPEPEAFDDMITFRLEPEIYSLPLLQAFHHALQRRAVDHYPLHLKLNTGMNRSGFDTPDLPALIHYLRAHRQSLHPRTVFSHLSASDEPAHDDFTLQQIHLFLRLSQQLQDAIDHPLWRHILNSAGIERFPDYHLDMVRLGIGLHGISAAGAPLRPVSTFKTHVIALRQVPPGTPVSYGLHTRVTRPTRLAVIPVGYADGLNHHLGNRVGQVYAGGQLVPILGNICMDACMIDATDIDLHVGDPVEIFGPHLPVTELADRLGTIPYEILTSISPRVKRLYYKE